MNLRGKKRTEFPQSVRKAAFIRCCINGDQKGVPQCESCGNVLRSGGIIYEHVQPDGLGGEPTLENCKVHCIVCAHVKTVTEDNPRMQKADRILKASFGLKRKSRPMPGSRASGWKRKLNGQVERRT